MPTQIIMEGDDVSPESSETSFAIIRKDISQIQRDVTTISNDLHSIREDTSNHYATKEEIGYIKEKLLFHDKILYGFIGLIVVAVIAAILNLVIGVRQ